MTFHACFPNWNCLLYRRIYSLRVSRQWRKSWVNGLKTEGYALTWHIHTSCPSEIFNTADAESKSFRLSSLEAKYKNINLDHRMVAIIGGSNDIANVIRGLITQRSSETKPPSTLKNAKGCKYVLIDCMTKLLLHWLTNHFIDCLMSPFLRVVLCVFR